jgi:hypothetical protein
MEAKRNMKYLVEDINNQRVFFPTFNTYLLFYLIFQL